MNTEGRVFVSSHPIPGVLKSSGFRKLSKEKRFNFPYFKDEDGSVADAFGAISTPHIFVLDSRRILRYKWRIDDSRDPSKATYSDLERALEDVLAHRTVRVPETKPFGCAIVR